VAPIIIVVMIAGTTALPVMSDTGTTATGMIVDLTVGTVPDRLPAGPSTMIVAPGLRPLGGRLMIEGLQGTMITGEEVMMIAEGLIIMLTDAGTIEDATRKKTASTKGLQGMRMEMVVGLVELFVVLGFRTQARREKKGGRLLRFLRCYVGSQSPRVALFMRSVYFLVNAPLVL
jgi:uncharacterized membrane protein YeaQ/YmgE (transglycosylase-associated protein family)